MKEYIAVLKAADAAARWHADQRRKGKAQEPYICHLTEVASLVAEATGGEDPNLIVAALLHDAVEDQQVPPALIADTWGEAVAGLVMEVTDNKSLDKGTRKQLQVVNAPHKSQRAKILKLADKISNLRALAASPPADWSVERRREYVEWARKVAKGLRGAHPWLEAEFDRAAAQAEASIRV